MFDNTLQILLIKIERDILVPQSQQDCIITSEHAKCLLKYSMLVPNMVHNRKCSKLIREDRKIKIGKIGNLSQKGARKIAYIPPAVTCGQQNYLYYGSMSDHVKYSQTWGARTPWE